MGIISKIKNFIKNPGSIGTAIATGGQSVTSSGKTFAGLAPRGATSTSGGGSTIGGVTIVPSAGTPSSPVRTGGGGSGGISSQGSAQQLSPQQQQQIAGVSPSQQIQPPSQQQRLTPQQRFAAAMAQRTGTITTQEVPAQQLDPVRSIDIARETPSGGVERVGGVTFKGRDVWRGRSGVREVDDGVEVSITPQQQEDRFQQGQQSAADLVFGDGSPTGGLLVTGREIGRTGEEADAFFEVQPSPPTFTERVATRISGTGFGSTKVGQNVVKNLWKTSESITRDQGLSVFESTMPIKDVQKVSGLPGVVRSGFAKFGIGAGQLAEEVGVPEPIATKGGRIVGDIALFGAFSPAFATSAQIQRQLGEIARVDIAGVTTRQGKGIRTDAVFTVTRAGRTVKGVATSQSFKQVIPRTQIVDIAGGGTATQTRNVQAVVSAAKAQTFTMGVKVPSGQIIVQQTGRGLSSAEIATIIQRGKLFFTKAVGTTRTGVRGERFVAGGVSTQRGQFIIQVGGTIQQSGQRAFFTGLFKLRTTPPRTTLRITTTGRPITKLSQVPPELVTANIQAIRNVVGQAVSIPPRQITNIVPVPTQRTSTISQREIKQITSSKQLQDTTTLQKTIQVVTPVQRTRTTTGQKTRTIQSQVPAQKELQKTITIQTQVPEQALRQRTLTLPRTLQRQRIPQRAIIPKIRIPKPKLPFLSPRLKPQQQLAQPSGKFPVLVRRFGEFRVVGFGRTPGEAAFIGRNIVSRTLAATFKVPSFKGTKVSGFRTKKEKEGIVFIEPRRRRLSTGSEVSEIQGYLKQSVKGGRR